MGLVLGQHHRAVGQLPELLVQVGEDLVAVGVALGDQAGPPPAGDLADAPVQGALADGGAAEPMPQPGDRPSHGLDEQPADASTQPWAAEPGSASPGPVIQAGHPVGVVAVDPAAHGGRVAAQQLGDRRRRPALAGQQDHDQPGADAVGPIQQPSHVARAAGRARGVGVHAGGTHTSGGLVGSTVLWKASATREATSRYGTLSTPSQLRTEPLVTRLARLCGRMRRRGAGW